MPEAALSLLAVFLPHGPQFTLVFLPSCGHAGLLLSVPTFLVGGWGGVNESAPDSLRESGAEGLGLAATYSPGCDPSTIGAAGLNFSVRDGKRCSPAP